jgi:hypothetical protein
MRFLLKWVSRSLDFEDHPHIGFGVATQQSEEHAT